MTEPDVEILPSAYVTSFPLAWVAGYVDAVGFLTLAGLFVAHMSGNTVRLGVFIGDGDWSFAAQRFVPIVFFTLGSSPASRSSKPCRRVAMARQNVRAAAQLPPAHIPLRDRDRTGKARKQDAV